MGDTDRGTDRVFYRKAKLTDARCIAEVHVESWRIAYRGLLPDSLLDSLSIAERQRLWDDRLPENDEATWVAEVDRGVVGFVTVGANRDADCDASSIGEVYGIYLASDVWRRGMGSELCRRGLAALRSSDYAQAMLWVLRARRFYETLGFRDDSTDKPCRISGCDLKEVRYRVDL